MAIDDRRARERYERLRNMLEESRRHIEWMLPFLNAKASQSGDVAGLQINAREHAKEISGMIRAYDVEDEVEAARLAGHEQLTSTKEV